MIVKIKKAIHPWAWYKDHIGDYFTVSKGEMSYIVTEGNYKGSHIMQEDAKVVKTKRVRVTKKNRRSGFHLWYDNAFGEIFEVEENPSGWAYSVMGVGNTGHLLDKDDVEDVEPEAKFRVGDDVVYTGLSPLMDKRGVITYVEDFEGIPIYGIKMNQGEMIRSNETNLRKFHWTDNFKVHTTLSLKDEPEAEFSVGDIVTYLTEIGKVTEVRCEFGDGKPEYTYCVQFVENWGVIPEEHLTAVTWEDYSNKLLATLDDYDFTLTVKNYKFSLGDVIKVPSRHTVGTVISIFTHTNKDKTVVTYEVEIGEGGNIVFVDEEETGLATFQDYAKIVLDRYKTDLVDRMGREAMKAVIKRSKKW
jgi:hypothetical protein